MDYRTYRDKLQSRFPDPVLAFEPNEYEARLASVRRGMAEAGFDLLLLTDAGELCYLTGYTTFEVSVQCVLLVASDRTVLFVPAIEIGPAVCLSRVDDVIGYPWQAPEAVASELATHVRRTAGTSAPRIGFDPWAGSFRPGLLSALKNTLDAATFSEAVIRAGVVDHEIARAGASSMLGAGSEFMSMQPIVTTGARSGIIHTNHAGYEVFTELGAVRRRYTAPMMRTAVVGQASPQQPAPARPHWRRLSIVPFSPAYLAIRLARRFRHPGSPAQCS